MKDRNNCLDTFKFLAIVCVFSGHFIGITKPELFDLLRLPPWYYFVGGFSGKFGVAVFAVISSYITYEEAFAGGGGSATRYILRRYFYFLLCAFVVNAGMWLINVIHITSETFTFVQFLKNTFLLGGEFFSPYWCIPSFLMISIVSELNGKGRVAFPAIALEIGFFVLLGGWLWLWVAIGLLGAFAASLQAWEPFRKTVFRVPVLPQLVLWGVALVIIKRPEGYLTYFLDGVACVLMILAVKNSRVLMRIFDNKYLAFCGRYTMEMYLMHLIVIYVSLRVFSVPPMPLPVLYVIDYFVLLGIALLLKQVLARGMKEFDRMLASFFRGT